MQNQLTFCHHSSRVKVTHCPLGLWRLDYSGVLGDSAFSVLRGQALRASQGAVLLNIHVEKALIMSSLMPPPCAAYQQNAAPAAVVVRPDQYQIWVDYAAAMACIGVTRLIFLESQQAQAQRFLDCWLDAQDLVARQTPAGKGAP